MSLIAACINSGSLEQAENYIEHIESKIPTIIKSRQKKPNDLEQDSRLIRLEAIQKHIQRAKEYIQQEQNSGKS